MKILTVELDQLWNGIQDKLWIIITGLITAGVATPLLNHYIVRPYTTDRKERLDKHQKYVVDIFQNWAKIRIELKKKENHFYSTCIPLYVDIDQKFLELDEYNEARDHLRNGYQKIFTLNEEIMQKTESHNKSVSEYMQQAEKELKARLYNDPNIHLADVEYLNSLFKDELSVDEALKTGKLGIQDIEVAQYSALNPTHGVYFDNLFEHLYLESKNRVKDILRVDYVTGGMGWIFPTLFRSDSKDKVIAKWLPASKSVAHLKQFLEKDCEDIVSQLKMFNTEINDIEAKLSLFRKAVLQIIHDFDVLGLKSKCRVDKELSILSKLDEYIKRNLGREPK